VDHDGTSCCHFVVVGRLIMVLTTFNSSTRGRVNKHAAPQYCHVGTWEGSSWCHQEIATQLLLTAAPSCWAACSCCALQLHSFEQLLVVVMREQLTVPWAAQRNFGTHSFNSCLLMTYLSL